MRASSWRSCGFKYQASPALRSNHYNASYHRRRPFSSTQPSFEQSIYRKQMFEWLNGPGKVFRDPRSSTTNYLNSYNSDGDRVTNRWKRSKEANDHSELDTEAAEVDEDNATTSTSGKKVNKTTREDLRVFPDNLFFHSPSVLSEALKQNIFNDVTRRGVTVREASQKFKVDMRRVAAVVRLKTMELQWVQQGKPLARPYATAVQKMLPQTAPGQTHESINDLPVHRATTAQRFYPIAESRPFTRADAGEVMQRGLLPADARIPHPQMVRALRRNEPDLPINAGERAAKLRAEMREQDTAAEQRATRRERRRQAHTTTIHQRRADFCFENVEVTAASTGSWSEGVGVRYGVPHQDRKKGEVKIPRRVE